AGDASLARVGRQICLGLVRSGDLELTLERPEGGPAEDSRLDPLRPCYDRVPSGPVDVTLRQTYPPDFTRPEQGRLVVILPWEYGRGGAGAARRGGARGRAGRGVRGGGVGAAAAGGEGVLRGGGRGGRRRPRRPGGGRGGTAAAGGGRGAPRGVDPAVGVRRGA